MMHILSSLPHFLAAILRYWITVLTGSAIAVGLWAFEHYLGRTITMVYRNCAVQPLYLLPSRGSMSTTNWSLPGMRPPWRE